MKVLEKLLENQGKVSDILVAYAEVLQGGVTVHDLSALDMVTKVANLMIEDAVKQIPVEMQEKFAKDKEQNIKFSEEMHKACFEIEEVGIQVVKKTDDIPETEENKTIH